MKLICLALVGLTGCVQLLGDFGDGTGDSGAANADGVSDAASASNGAARDDAQNDGSFGGQPEGFADAGLDADAMTLMEAAAPALCCVNATQASQSFGTCPAQSPACASGDVYCDSRGVGWNCWTHPAGTSSDPSVCGTENCCSAFVGVCP